MARNNAPSGARPGAQPLADSGVGPTTGTNVTVEAERRDRVRWGPVWAGLIVVLPTFLVLELIALALGWLDLAPGEGGGGGIVTGIIGLLAFFLGGLTAGATAMWRGADDGLLHGILVWALGVVAILLLTLLGGGALFGSLASAATEVVNLQQVGQAAQGVDVDPAQAAETARTAGGAAALGLGATIVASALGGLLGAKMWPRKKDVENDTVTVH
ncbi:permease [Quadrisphaera sp. DSM 44207]|uniref:permease n=1 Tax=Quadrisphaera sp. DSM 44207 TaxID=1881057 RepID=UPI0008820F4F|nr:permease [Quadrisphaera sp. DSM 44207]SDQ04730.1 hypothetical protein SAMN05428996_0171 [Quadrisphaera sp. DSM 44207]